MQFLAPCKANVIHNKVTYFSQKRIEYIRLKFSKIANLNAGLSKFRSAISISTSENNKQSACNAHFQHCFKSFSHLSNIKVSSQTFLADSNSGP